MPSLPKMNSEEDELTLRFNALLRQQGNAGLSGQQKEVPRVFRRPDIQSEIPVLTDAILPEDEEEMDHILLETPQWDEPVHEFLREQALRKIPAASIPVNPEKYLSESVRLLLGDLMPVIKDHLAHALEKACEDALHDFEHQVRKITEECAADLIQVLANQIRAKPRP
ncbi:MAG TPA: hypothetical protein VND43_05235 [Burkholderiales bacterium]|nr:hypothetical protein [Burkholderiales bacterium]